MFDNISYEIISSIFTISRYNWSIKKKSLKIKIFIIEVEKMNNYQFLLKWKVKLIKNTSNHFFLNNKFNFVKELFYI